MSGTSIETGSTDIGPECQDPGVAEGDSYVRSCTASHTDKRQIKSYLPLLLTYCHS